MQIDTIRAVFTYVMALVVVVGGGAFLLAVRNDTPPNDLITGAAISVVTLAVQFVFSKEQQTATARQSERAFLAGYSLPGAVVVPRPPTPSE